jgi:hypothetical protein
MAVGGVVGLANFLVWLAYGIDGGVAFLAGLCIFLFFIAATK